MLALVMLITVLLPSASVFAQGKVPVEQFHSIRKEDSYIIVDSVEGNVQPTAEKYVTTRTSNNGDYRSVIRGDIFVEFPNNPDASTYYDINLKANKEFGFRAPNEDVVPNGVSRQRLRINQEYRYELIIPENLQASYEEGTYVIKLVKSGDTVKVKMSIDYSNADAWLNGDYLPNGTKPPSTNDHKSRVEDAILGFNNEGVQVADIFYVEKGTSAMEVLAKFGEAHNLNITGIENNYVSQMGITGHETLGEFHINSRSGWMYIINDTDFEEPDDDGWYFPNVGAAAKTFINDANMKWCFTLNYGADIEAGWGSPMGAMVIR